MTDSRFALATDLDGTFTGGSAAARAELHEVLAAGACDALIYITGRAAASARALIAREQLPTPTMLVSDVGTCILEHADRHVTELERLIADTWPGRAAVQERLIHVAGLQPQDVAAPYRASYWITDNRALRAPAGNDEFEARGPDDPSLSDTAAATAARAAMVAAQALTDLPVDVMVSGNVYLDVLPAGVNKGSTLLRVLEYLQIPLEHCIVAGDSLNDRALFEIGAAGIVVGNCEPALRTAVGNRSGVYMAHADGAAGILEGLRQLGRLGTVGKGTTNGQ